MESIKKPSIEDNGYVAQYPAGSHEDDVRRYGWTEDTFTLAEMMIGWREWGDGGTATSPLLNEIVVFMIQFGVQQTHLPYTFWFCWTKWRRAKHGLV